MGTTANLPNKLKREFIGKCISVFCASLSGAVSASEITVERDVVWDTANQLKTDIYRPEMGQNMPVVLLIHGGGWTGGNKSEMEMIGRKLAQEGWVALSIDYRLATTPGKILFDGALGDVSNAVAVIQANAIRLKIDPKRMAILGASAGGHLAAMVATNSKSLLRGAVVLWGPTDLTIPKSEMNPRQFGMVSNLLGKDYPMDRARKASPMWNISSGASAPHWLLIHGRMDDLVPADQSRRFTRSLKRTGLDAEYIEFASEGHGLSTQITQQTGIKEVVRFLKRIL